jgi:hypothetical protein
MVARCGTSAFKTCESLARTMSARREGAPGASAGSRSHAAAVAKIAAAPIAFSRRDDVRIRLRSVYCGRGFIVRSVDGGVTPLRRIKITIWPYSFMLWLTTPINAWPRGAWVWPCCTISASDASVCAA